MRNLQLCAMVFTYESPAIEDSMDDTRTFDMQLNYDNIDLLKLIASQSDGGNWQVKTHCI